MINSANNNMRVLGGVSGYIFRCLILLLMVVGGPSWYNEFESSLIKFISGVPIIMTFDGAVPLTEEATFKDGTKGKVLRWDVTVYEGETRKKKVLPITSKRLKDLLMAQDKVNPLQGRTFRITAFGDNLQRTWTVEAVQL